MGREIIWQIESNYALVSCINNGRGIIVEKEIAPKDVNITNISWVNEVSIFFREKLSKLGVPLASPYLCFEKDGKAIQQSPYVGLDIEKIFQGGKAELLIIEKMLTAMKGVLEQKTPEVGIDARLSNFCIGPNNEIYYVDTFPPLVKYGEKYIVHFPNPTNQKTIQEELKRKFDPMGILRRFRFAILEQNVGFTENDILCCIHNALGYELAAKAKNFFTTFLDHLEVNDAFDQLNLNDPDGIRELALKLIPSNGDRKIFLKEIFNLSSNFCPYNLTKKERMDKIKILMQAQICV